MTGEIEEPFRLNILGDSFHSGSISFGRFESEAALCWERRSSFLHNRYLEEVEKYSKPGLVIEKKAYFEAHFRKKGILGHTSPSSKKEYQKSENDISEKILVEEIGHTNGENLSSCSDESPDSSVYERVNDVANCEIEKFGTLISDPEIEIACDDSNDAKIVLSKEDYPKHGDSLSFNSISGSEMQEKLDCESRNFYKIHLPEIAVRPFCDSHATEENESSIAIHQQGSYLKEKVEPESGYMKPGGMMPHIGVAESKRRISRNEVKGSQKKPIEKVNNVVRRSLTKTKTSESAAQIKGLMHKPVSKTKGVNVIKSGGKEIRNRTNVCSQSSTVQKVSTSVHQSANRVKPTIGATKPSTKQDQLHPKTQEKKQLKNSLDFKSTPLPSLYHETLRDSDRNKHSATSVKPRKLRTNSSLTETKVSNKSSINSEERSKKTITKNGDSKFS